MQRAATLSSLLIFLTVILFYPLAATAQGPDGNNTTLRTKVFTTDAQEEAIYKRSPAGKADAAQKSAAAPAPDQADAAATPSGGLKRLTFVPDDQGPATDKPADQTENGAAPKTQTATIKAAPAGPTPITPAAKLKPFDDLVDAYASGTKNDDQTRVMLARLEESPGRIPPLGLLQMAVLYESLGDIKSAARYYYAAQLRARFDAARFGPKGAAIRRKVAEQANDLTPRLGPWIAQSSARLNDVLGDVRAWDLATPYDYHPGFGVMSDDLAPRPDDLTRNDAAAARNSDQSPPPESTWPDVLDDTRASFFREAGALATALQKMGK